MSNYSGGRRAPNLSRYLQDLNVIPPENPTEETFTTGDDLSMFMNTQFFDADLGQNTDFQAQPAKPDVDSNNQSTSHAEDDASGTPVISDFPGLDFNIGEFNFGDFSQQYTSPVIPSFPENLGNLQPIQPTPQTSVYPSVPQPQTHYASQAPRLGEKRKPEAASPTQDVNLEDKTRVAAEEDKRRRNTAASARFRVKKKQREQALEKTAKELGDKVGALENRISQLETENKWLKALVMEKNGSEDMASVLKEFSNKQSAAKGAAKEKPGSSAEALKEETR